MEVSAHVRAFNNDPYNQSGGWELKEENWVAGWTSTALSVYTAWVYMGGAYEDCIHQCTQVIGIECYATTLNYFYGRWGSSIPYYTSVSTDYANHVQASYQCWEYPGC